MEAVSDRIRRLSKEWIETGDDRLLDKIDKLSELKTNFLPGNRFLERYEGGALRLCLNIFHRAACADVATEDLLMVADHGVEPLRGACECLRGWVAKCDALIGDDTTGNDECSVLVDVFEFMEYPQRLINRARVRLQPLNDHLRFGGYAAESVPLQCPDEHVGGIADRKQVGGAGSLSVDQHKLVDQMVEGAPEVMDAVANNRSNVRGRIGHFKDVANRSRICIYLANDLILKGTVGMRECGYRVQVVPCATDFQADAVE